MTESSPWLYDAKLLCVDPTKAVANRRNALQSSYSRLVAAEILRPASRVFRTWDRRATSSWLCEAMEWVKTTRKGAKEEKRSILLLVYQNPSSPLVRTWKDRMEWGGGTHHPEYTLMLGVLFEDKWPQFSTWHCRAMRAAWYLFELMCVAAAGEALAPYKRVRM